MQCIITEKQSNQIHYDDTKKAHDSQIVRAKQKQSKLSNCGPSQRQASVTNYWINFLLQGRH